MRESDVVPVWIKRIATSAVLIGLRFSLCVGILLVVSQLRCLLWTDVSAHGAGAEALGRVSLFTEVPSRAWQLMSTCIFFLFKQLLA